MEYAHLLRMCEFFGRFVEALVRSRSAHLSLATEFNQRRNLELNAESLLLNMVEERGTGQQEPLPAEFEDVEVAAAFLDAPTELPSSPTTSQSTTPCPAHLTSDSNGLRAASALPGSKTHSVLDCINIHRNGLADSLGIHCKIKTNK